MSRPARQAATVAVVAAAAATACTSNDPSGPDIEADHVVSAQAGADVTLAPGNTARVVDANLNVHFTRVIGDSRCPTQALVQCVWAGSVIVKIQAGPINGFQYLATRTLETVSGRDTATVEGQLIRLLRVTPAKEMTDSIPTGRYRIVLRVGAAR